MKISNLLKISALCCTVLCGVSNNTCNAVKLINCKNNSLNCMDKQITEKIFKQSDNIVKQNINIENQSLSHAFLNNIIIHNNKEAIRLLPKQNRIVHYSIGNNKSTTLLHTVQNSLNKWEKNIKSIRGLKEKLPSNYEISRFYRKCYDNEKRVASYKLKHFDIKVNFDDQMDNFIEERQIIMEQNKIITKIGEINNIFKNNMSKKNNNTIPLQVLLPQNKTVSIYCGCNVFFYKNGNIKAYYFTEGTQNNKLDLNTIKNKFITLNSELSKENFQVTDEMSDSDKISLVRKILFKVFGENSNIENI